MAALLDCARKYPDAIIPGYTHTRRAQPVLWPHYLLAYFEMFARDHQRFTEARGRTDRMPLGSGALAGSGFPFDREAIARQLGFAAVKPEDLVALGTQPAPDSVAHVRLLTALSSASTKQGQAVEALVTVPLFSPEHKLVLPEGTIVSARPTAAANATAPITTARRGRFSAKYFFNCIASASVCSRKTCGRSHPGIPAFGRAPVAITSRS